MPRKLDFIVGGTARSGTTAVANYLSAVDKIHCGIELFRFYADHSKLYAPDCFFDLATRAATGEKVGALPVHIQSSVAEITRKGDRIELYGNKTPYYYYRLQPILDSLETPRAIVCTRNILNVAKSYDRRSSDADDNFHEGRTAFYAAADVMFLAKTLAEADGDSVLIVPNQTVVDDWESATRRMVEFLAPGMNYSFEPDAIAQIQRKHERHKEKVADADVAMHDLDRKLVRLVIRSGLDEVLNRDAPFLLRDIKADMAEVLAKLPPIPMNFLNKQRQLHPLPAVSDYFAKWRYQVESAGKEPKRAKAH